MLRLCRDYAINLNNLNVAKDGYPLLLLSLNENIVKRFMTCYAGCRVVPLSAGNIRKLQQAN